MLPYKFKFIKKIQFNWCIYKVRGVVGPTLERIEAVVKSKVALNTLGSTVFTWGVSKAWNGNWTGMWNGMVEWNDVRHIDVQTYMFEQQFVQTKFS